MDQRWCGAVVAMFVAGTAGAATTVPTDVQMPGTQPGEASGIESVSRCDNCHGNFASPGVPREEPWFNWAGGMMAHASRDPVFWATVAIAEQDFDGSGDLCIRCHVPEGWLAGRSTPTDGSALAAGTRTVCNATSVIVSPTPMGSSTWASRTRPSSRTTGVPRRSPSSAVRCT